MHFNFVGWLQLKAEYNFTGNGTIFKRCTIGLVNDNASIAKVAHAKQPVTIARHRLPEGIMNYIHKTGIQF